VLRHRWAAVLVLAALGELAGPAQADVFTDPASFFTAASALGSPVTLTFEGLSVGTTIPDGGTAAGITFTSSIGLDLIVSSGFDTTSGFNYLGVADGADEVFIALDEWEMLFAAPIQALGLYFISSDPLFADDIQLVTSAGTAQNAGVENAVLADGGLAYFVGFVSATPFASAQVRYGPGVTGQNFVYNVDDISTVEVAAIPEPSGFVLAASVIVAAWPLLRRAARRQR
jgi:hypothetical protein